MKKRVMGFTEYFVNEKAMDIKDPEKAGEILKSIVVKNKNVKEIPKGSNKGPDVNKYLSSVGLSPGNPWCASFVYYIFNELSNKLGITNPLPKTGGVLDFWAKSDKALKIDIKDARADISKVKKGQIFIMAFKGGKGHMGIVLDVLPNTKEFITLEGNTTDQGSREGERVGMNKRSINQGNLIGFVDYFSGKRDPKFEEALKKSLDPKIISSSVIDKDIQNPDLKDIKGEKNTLWKSIESNILSLLGYSDSGSEESDSGETEEDVTI
jgi:hypothetical protein